VDLHRLIQEAQTIETVIDGSSWRLDETIDAVIASEDWDWAGRLLVSAGEIAARQLVAKLLEKEAYVALATAACLRRQPRRPGEGAVGGGGQVAARVFRDIDAEEGGAGVPDYIRADIDEMAKGASQNRASALARDAEMDRDPIRQYIVDNLARKMSASEAAMDAVVVIARASAWEETRRTAALKLANDELCVTRLAKALRSEDIAAVCEEALLGVVAENFAKAMGKHFQDYIEKKDAIGLRFIAEHHPAAQYKESAAQWAEEVEGGSEKT